MSKIEILYSADGYAVVKKPIGADSEDKGPGSVPSLVREILGIEYATPCHRLDRAVGGAMLVATDKNSAARLSGQVSEGRIKKEYLCVCEGSFCAQEESGTLEDLLFFDRQKQKSFPAKKLRRGVKEASLSYRVISQTKLPDGRSIALVWVILHTGRTHQIRVQFASRRHPILGDGKYGSRDKCPSIALCCYAITAYGVRTVCSPALTYPWNLFRGYDEITPQSSDKLQASESIGEH